MMQRKVPKGKTLIFLKVLRGSVTLDTIDYEVMGMEMSGTMPFEKIELLSHEVFSPDCLTHEIKLNGDTCRHKRSWMDFMVSSCIQPSNAVKSKERNSCQWLQ